METEVIRDRMAAKSAIKCRPHKPYEASRIKFSHRKDSSYFMNSMVFLHWEYIPFLREYRKKKPDGGIRDVAQME